MMILNKLLAITSCRSNLRPKNIMGCCRRHRLQSSASPSCSFSSDTTRKGDESSSADIIEREKKIDVNDHQMISNVLVEMYTSSSSSSSSPSTAHKPLASIAASTIPVLDAERMEMTRLVDDLLWKTQQQMLKLPRQHNQQHHEQHHIIAFSGGVDSSLAAAIVHRCAQQQEQQRQLSSSSSSSSSSTTEIIARAVLGTSPAVPAEQIQQAEAIAQHIGIDFDMVPTTEGQDEMYIANAGQACLACKTHLYSTLQAIAQHASDTAAAAATSTTTTAGSSLTFGSLPNHSLNNPRHEHKHEYHSRSFSTSSVQLYNGTNADDLLDETRLGLIAANDYRVHAPLQDLTKNMVRQVARHLGLPNWNHAAQPCLRSRLALGVPATQHDLQRIERAERFVRNTLLQQQQQQQANFEGGAESVPRFDESCNMRVRLFSGDRACIEVDAVQLPRVEKVDWKNGFLVKGLHFSAVSTRAFKSGSVAPKAATTAAKKKPVGATSRGHATNTTHKSDDNDDRSADQVSMATASL